MSADPSIALGTRAAATAVTGAIRQAAQTTGVSFDYLLATAKVESDLNPNLTMKSSTATGLFQFLEQTWLGVLKDTGGVLGYGRYASAIEQTPSGRYVVGDPALRNEIMALRKDPTANAVMGGAITQQNAAQVARRIGRKPTDGELYVAHFFGPVSAAKVINLASSNPTANAAAMFPRAAAANRPIFYDKSGNPRSISGVYAELVRRYQVASARTSSTSAIAAAGPLNAPTGIGAARAPVRVASSQAATLLSPFPIGSTPAVDAAGASVNAPSDGPVFHSLFHAGDRRGAVAPLVAQLWGAGAANTDLDASAETPATAPALDGTGTSGTASRHPAGLANLFSDPSR